MKEAHLKWLHAVWSQLYDIMEKAKLWRNKKATDAENIVGVVVVASHTCTCLRTALGWRVYLAQRCLRWFILLLPENQSVLQGSLISRNREWCLQTKVWVFQVLISTREWLLLGSQWTDLGTMCMDNNSHVHIYNVCIYICIQIMYTYT